LAVTLAVSRQLSDSPRENTSSHSGRT
jgi:hypothetical protein